MDHGTVHIAEHDDLARELYLPKIQSLLGRLNDHMLDDCIPDFIDNDQFRHIYSDIKDAASRRELDDLCLGIFDIENLARTLVSLMCRNLRGIITIGGGIITIGAAAGEGLPEEFPMSYGPHKSKGE